MSGTNGAGRVLPERLAPVRAALRDLAVALALVTSGIAAASPPLTLHVDPDAPSGGNGRTWDTSFRFLADALASAASMPWAVAEIRVSGGRFTPDRSAANPQGTGLRTSSFALVPNVAVRGGFAGLGAADPDFQDLSQFETLLDGDLAGNDQPNFVQIGENAFHVVQAGAVGAAPGAVYVVEGCTIRGGNARIQSGVPAAEAKGGGVKILSGVLRLSNVSLRDNIADTGGAVYVAPGARAFVTAGDCSGNRADSKGGATMCDGPLTLDSVALLSNAAPIGGAVMAATTVPLTVLTCDFMANVGLAGGDGSGGGAAIDTAGGACRVLASTFLANTTPYSGGAIFCRDGPIRIEGSEFTGNYAGSGGGAISHVSYVPVRCDVVDCLFRLNTSAAGGGGMACTSCMESVVRCRFELNDAESGTGGGLVVGPNSNCQSAPQSAVIGCTFLQNAAKTGGGGAFFFGSVAVRGCDFAENAAYSTTASGGGASASSPVAFECCRFVGNYAGGTGGGVFFGGPSSLSHCTVAANSSLFGAGGVDFNTGIVQASILWGNSGAGRLESMQVVKGISALLQKSCIQGLSSYAGNGNIGADPKFVDSFGADHVLGTSDDDLHLSAASPCLDTIGSPLISACTLDLDANNRNTNIPGVGLEQGYAADMGAYERTSPPGADCDGDWLDDPCALAQGAASDCLGTGTPSGCLLLGGGDTNLNNTPDVCEVAAGAPDCNGNGIPDAWDLAMGTLIDCDGDGIPDSCAIAAGLVPDCNHNGIPDSCDILMGISLDANHDGIPDECADCNRNGIGDLVEILLGLAPDCNGNGIPDACDIANGAPDTDGDGIPDECARDCNHNGIPDMQEIASGLAQDCNHNGIPDECEIADGTLADFNDNGIPDICEPDCNANGIPDFIEILYGLVPDENRNGIPDGCELLGDLNGDGVVGGADLGILLGAWGPCPSQPPCPADINGDGIVNGADLALLLGAWS